MRNLRTFALGALAIIGLGAVLGVAQTVRTPLRYIPPPADFYVSTSGSDGNKCTSGAPCLTIPHALSYILSQYDFQGQTVNLHVGAGTFSGDQITVNGPLPGSAGITTAGALNIVGAGKTSTTLTNSTCGTGNNTIQANNGAHVTVGSLTLTTTCASGSDLVAFNKASVELSDANVRFGAAPYARVFVTDQSRFGSGFNFEIASGGSYGFAVLNNSVVLYGVVTVTLTGTPAYSVGFVDAINGSLFADGGSTYSGSATGPQYSLNNSSTIDKESNTTGLPGNSLGILGQSSSYTPTLLACMGGAGGCAITNTPTGLGTGGTATLVAGAGARTGIISLNTGSGSTANSGNVYVGLPGLLLNGNCFATPGIGSTQWAVGAVMETAYGTASGNPYALVTWYNGGGTILTTGTTYFINYNCNTSG